MLPVGRCLDEIVQAEEFRGSAPAQCAKLWKDEPHPVRRFAAGRQFETHYFEHRVLRLDKSLQVEWIVGDGR